ncbi:MAG: hypothetical protein VX589_15925 [Myxococcota bacterium]|nr:hypothetical protein [Myxococcota bacterium]
MRKRVLMSASVVALMWLGCADNHDDHDHEHGHSHGASDGVEAVGDQTSTTAPIAQDAARLVIHVEGRSAGGMIQPLSQANIYVKEPHEGDADHHHHPEGDPDGVTNEFGDVEINIKPDTLYVVHVEAPEFDTLVRRIKVEGGQQEQLWLTITEMIRKKVKLPETGEIKLKLGETPGGSQDPVTLTIEAGDLGLDEGKGSAATGEIEVVFGSWDPEVDDPTTLPSDLLTADGPLYSYSMFHIEFYQGDEVLNVRDGQTIRVESRVNEARRDLAIEAIEASKMNLYSLNHNTGLWIDDDVTIAYNEDTGVLSAEATHFSHKNYDRPGPYPGVSCVEGRAVNREGTQLSNVEFNLRGEGRMRNGCANTNCLMLDDGNVRAANQVDSNGDGVVDEDDDAADCRNQFDEFQQRGNDCDLRRGVERQIRHAVTAKRKVPGTNYWQEGSAEASSVCVDHDVGCGVGNCGTATIELCSPRGGGCAERADCCGTDGCFSGECDECIVEGQTCEVTDECCPGLDCLDFTCKSKN